MALAGAGRRRVRALPAAPHLDSTATRSLGTNVNLTQIISLALALALTAGGQRSSCASRSSAPRCGRSRTTARSPRRSACPCAGRGGGLVRLGARLRRRRAPAARPAHVARLLGAHVPRHLVARGGADRPAALALGDALRRPRRRARAVGPHALRDVSTYRSAAPFVLAIVALLYPLAPPRRLGLADGQLTP